jgi:hypothetical protein
MKLSLIPSVKNITIQNEKLKTNLNPVITTKTIKLIEQLQHSSLYLPVSTHFTAISHNMNHEVAEILYYFFLKN